MRPLLTLIMFAGCVSVTILRKKLGISHGANVAFIVAAVLSFWVFLNIVDPSDDSSDTKKDHDAED